MRRPSAHYDILKEPVTEIKFPNGLHVIITGQFPGNCCLVLSVRSTRVSYSGCYDDELDAVADYIFYFLAWARMAPKSALL